jgi:hypothetical protein
MISADDPSRQALADAQRDVAYRLAGLSAGASRIDAGKLSLAGRSLLAKRMRAVERSWPGLAGSQGDDFAARFGAFAASHPLPADASSVTDGARFAQFLHRAGTLSDEARIEWLRYRVRRQWFAMAWCRQRRRPAVGIRMPWAIRRLIIFGAKG